jgi:hypothetical protein
MGDQNQSGLRSRLPISIAAPRHALQRWVLGGQSSPPSAEAGDVEKRRVPPSAKPLLTIELAVDKLPPHACRPARLCIADR